MEVFISVSTKANEEEPVITQGSLARSLRSILPADVKLTVDQHGYIKISPFYKEVMRKVRPFLKDLGFKVIDSVNAGQKTPPTKWIVRMGATKFNMNVDRDGNLLIHYK